jgi:sugar (pentulose or hexulose) kinase
MSLRFLKYQFTIIHKRLTVWVEQKPDEWWKAFIKVMIRLVEKSVQLKELM